ncbi:MAG: hypothetical protein HGA85_06680, partial [Nanoarchaeota archaeon]|nr:hypothetical protein [Nanoarchaeota archaeon]
ELSEGLVKRIERDILLFTQVAPQEKLAELSAYSGMVQTPIAEAHVLLTTDKPTQYLGHVGMMADMQGTFILALRTSTKFDAGQVLGSYAASLSES